MFRPASRQRMRGGLANGVYDQKRFSVHVNVNPSKHPLYSEHCESFL